MTLGNMILLSCCGLIILFLFLYVFQIYWYRQGDLDPKFLRMIFFNTFTMILLCVCGNLYIHNIKTGEK